MAETATQIDIDAIMSAPPTRHMYVRDESYLHSLYKEGSPSYAAFFERYGKTLSESRAASFAGQHGTTLEALAEEGLTPYPIKRGESRETTPATYGTAHLFSALGY